MVKKPAMTAPTPEALVKAAEKVLAGLLDRIDAAPKNAVPVFAGIADLHDALAKARRMR